MAQNQIRGNVKIGQPKSARMVAHGLRARAWWAIRRLGVFTKPELLCTVATAADGNASNNLGGYLRALVSAGILTVETNRIKTGTVKSSNGFMRYRLVLNLGHKPPVWRVKALQVYDPNTQKTFEIGANHA